MFRAGAAAATLEVNIIAKEGLDKVAAILRIKAFYISWHTVVYKKEASCKARKEFLESYKKTNAIARLTAALKKAPLLKILL
jgi:replicative DNA helicase